MDLCNSLGESNGWVGKLLTHLDKSTYQDVLRYFDLGGVPYAWIGLLNSIAFMSMRAAHSRNAYGMNFRLACEAAVSMAGKARAV